MQKIVREKILVSYRFPSPSICDSIKQITDEMEDFCMSLCFEVESALYQNRLNGLEGTGEVSKTHKGWVIQD